MLYYKLIYNVANCNATSASFNFGVPLSKAISKTLTRNHTSAVGCYAVKLKKTRR